MIDEEESSIDDNGLVTLPPILFDTPKAPTTSFPKSFAIELITTLPSEKINLPKKIGKEITKVFFNVELLNETFLIK